MPSFMDMLPIYAALMFLGVVVWIGCAILCGYVAEEKGHGFAEWLLLGVLLGVVALIAVAGLPVRDARRRSTRQTLGSRITGSHLQEKEKPPAPHTSIDV